MLYIKNGEIYIKVVEDFIKVDIKKDKNGGYTVIPEDEKIEAYGNADKFTPISLEEAYKVLHKESKFVSSLDDTKIEK